MINQKTIENILHPRNVKKRLKESLDTDLAEYIAHGTKLVTEYIDTPMWESAEKRKDSIRSHDIYGLVLDIITSITMTCQQGLPLVSVASMITLSDELSNIDNIQLSADLISILVDTGTFQLDKSVGGTYVVYSCIEPNESIQVSMKVGCYLPPLIEKPKLLESNDDSGYHTIKRDSLILKGKINQHSECLSIDFLNKLNSTQFRVNNYIASMPKPWIREVIPDRELALLGVEELEKYNSQLRTYELYKEQFDYLKTIVQDKPIYFTHKVDKRGRVYVQAYHFSYQAKDYDKALVDLYKEEYITGEL